MIYLLISLAIAATLIGVIMIYSSISDFFIQRTKSVLQAARRSRLLRLAYYRPLSDIRRRINRGLALRPAPLSADTTSNNKLFVIMKRSSNS
jgi:hypothetical protein